jgi:choline transport protein
MVTSAVLQYLNISYAIPQGMVLVQGRKKSLPIRPLNLSYFGYFCNLFSTLWVIVLGVFVCFPPALPVDVGTTNYRSVILVGLFAIIIAFLFIIGNKFQCPKIEWEALNANNALETK